MQIHASNTQLGTARVLDAGQPVREKPAVAGRPAQDSFVPGVKLDREVDQLVRLLQRYFEGRPGVGNNAGIADKIDRLVARIEFGLGERLSGAAADDGTATNSPSPTGTVGSPAQTSDGSEIGRQVDVLT